MKKNVAILSGGFSSEFDVSIQSGDVIFQNIDRNKYAPFKIVIQKDSWLYHSSDGEKIAVNKEDFSIEIGKNRINFDVIIIMTAGPEPEIPAALAPLTNASLAILRPSPSSKTPLTARPFHVMLFNKSPSWIALSACWKSLKKGWKSSRVTGCFSLSLDLIKTVQSLLSGPRP